ncbi:hypothetical protein NQD34_004152 [Periophthalmus magnuspinnatus]|nr:hypothetical protein NQD34_004152 [Periophthalmus magnuspinnatus]
MKRSLTSLRAQRRGQSSSLLREWLLRLAAGLSLAGVVSVREHLLLSKRCSGLSTCVLGKLSQDLHKLQTFPRTNVGAGTPGRKRSALSNLSYQNLEREAEHGGVLGTLGTLGMLGQRFSLDQD